MVPLRLFTLIILKSANNGKKINKFRKQEKKTLTYPSLLIRSDFCKPLFWYVLVCFGYLKKRKRKTSVNKLLK